MLAAQEITKRPINLLPDLYDVLCWDLKSKEQSVVSPAMELLVSRLRITREQSTPEEWAVAIDEGRTHRVCGLVHQDPFSSRSFYKPDGYPGDARLLDYIYGDGRHEQGLLNSTDIGKRIFVSNRMSSACKAVRNRKDLIAVEIEQTLRAKRNARILSIACGHLREGRLINWDAARNLDLFVAMDQDATSLAEVERSAFHKNLQARQGSVSSIVRGTLGESEFDLIYSLGLYDYLEPKFAARLTARSFDLLRSGGKLIIGNFHEHTVDRGYMEMFMDWFLIYRNEQQMLDLAREVIKGQIGHFDLNFEKEKQILMLEIVKK